MEAVSAGLIMPTLVCPASKIVAAAQEGKLDIAGYEVIDAAS